MTGMAQARSMLICRIRRGAVATRFMRTAIRVPTTIVIAALTKQNANDRAMTVHIVRSVTSSR